MWAVVMVLAVAWGVVCWRERRPQRSGKRAAHRPVPGPRLRSARSVQEIQRRLATEAAAAAKPPPARNIEVLARAAGQAPPPLAGPADAGSPTQPFRPPDDEHDGDGP
ncbi:MAG: hypothetical protein ABR608_07440 [Pseudonocardiaceae bacterium]